MPQDGSTDELGTDHLGLIDDRVRMLAHSQHNVQGDGSSGGDIRLCGYRERIDEGLRMRLADILKQTNDERLNGGTGSLDSSDDLIS